MAIVSLTPPEQADGKLAELYATAEQFLGGVPSNVQLYGVSPDILENQLYFMEYYSKHATLAPPLLSMIRMLVARACKSPYCDQYNVNVLKKLGFNMEQIDAARMDPAQAPLTDKEKAMLLFVLKATSDPLAVAPADLDKLRAMGWTDRDMVDAVAHGARAVSTNIVFDTFKID